MKKIGFIGAFEKTDLIIYIAKILTEIGKRVLMIDTTILQKARYIIPCIAPTKFYVTEYEKIDVAVGFEDLESLKLYLEDLESNYDIILIDIDSYEAFDKFQLMNAEKLYFVTAFDSFSLKKGIEIIGTMREKVKMKKVLFEREIIEDNNQYLNLLSLTYPIEWDKKITYFPYEQGDFTAIIENQRVTKIKLRNLSEQYRDSLFVLAQEIAPDKKTSEFKRALKNL
ncbi:MAG: hypothetical protein Q4G09_01130 [Clostridia bacterium]|nr:hypothetical protein [Clostridia bacterium]